MLTRLGQDVIKLLDGIGEYVIFTGDIFRHLFSKRVKLRRVFQQMLMIGNKSAPIVIITLIFVGLVFTNQVTKEFTRIGAGKIIGGIVGFAIWRELGPLFAGVVVAARVGAAISTQISAMKVSEQIDALRAMGISPFTYLYVPRFIALLLMMPILVVFANFIGFFSGMFIYVILYHGNPYAFIGSAAHMLHSLDIYSGILIKAPVFGFIIATYSMFIGSKTSGGAAGIGMSATLTVVSILVTLFIANFFLSYLIF